MKRKYLLLEPTVETQGGNQVDNSGTRVESPHTVVPPADGGTTVADLKKQQAASGQPRQSRPPTEAEKSVEFKLEPGDPGFVDGFNENVTEQIPGVEKKEPVVPKEKQAPKEEKKPIVEDGPLAPVRKVTETPKTETPVKKVAASDGGPLAPVGKGSARDYAGFDEAEKKVFAAMSHEAFNYVAPLLKERKELLKTKDTVYLQHPEAFRLDPRYKALEDDATFFNKEAQHWQQQLLNIRAGKQWQPVTAWKKDGSPVLGEVREATPQDEEQVRMNMNHCFSLVNQSQAQLQSAAQQYSQAVQEDSNTINSIRAREFAWVADPKVLDDEVVLRSGHTQSVKQIREEIKGLLPSYHQGNILADLVADLYVGNQILHQKLREASNTVHATETRVAEVLRAEPSSDQRPASNGAEKVIGGVKMFSLDGSPV